MYTVLPVLMRAMTKTDWEAADEMPNNFFNPAYPSESTESLLMSLNFVEMSILSFMLYKTLVRSISAISWENFANPCH